MLFNSYPFLFLFFPLALGSYYLLAQFQQRYAIAGLSLASLLFYAWWDVRYVALLLFSVVTNYGFGRLLANKALARRPLLKQTFLGTAVALNLLLLCGYKYLNFFAVFLGSVHLIEWQLITIILPLGISFYTFTQIAFLVDVYNGKAREYEFLNYLLFVTYFPHLIAGPILHHSEMIVQFCDENRGKWNSRNFASGFFVFSVGLAKKVLLADSLAEFAKPLFDGSRDQVMVGFLPAWAGVLAYTFQLYFDFSGYSDMAIGLSRMFNIELPLNFHSPYKAQSITEFWRRWHMTLSRFLRDYLYIPLGGNKRGETRRNINLLITMLLGGLWHGAGWTFVIWGGWHGLALIVDHGWSRSRIGMMLSVQIRGVYRYIGCVLTFGTVTIGWVFFRSSSFTSALEILSGMFGLNGHGLSAEWLSRFGAFGQWLLAHGATAAAPQPFSGMTELAWITLAGLIVFLAPNTQELVVQPSGEKLDATIEVLQSCKWWQWQPTLTWALINGLLFAFGLGAINKISPFLYYQF